MEKSYHSLDILKFILSFLVVSLYFNLLGTKHQYLLYPLVRIAVPLFFIISGFLFFQKYLNKDSIEKKRLLFVFCKNNLKLYFTWLLIQFPIVVYYRGYSITELGRFIKSLLFGSTFTASWYLMALVLGVVLICFFTKYLSNRKCLILAFAIYTICCLCSNYAQFTYTKEFAQIIINFYPVDIYNSLPVSLIWLIIGKTVAEKKEVLLQIKNKTVIGFTTIFLLLLFVEHYLISYYGLSLANDCYFMLVPLCPCIFITTLKMDKIKANIDFKMLRSLSTIIYCSHGAIGRLLRKGMTLVGLQPVELPLSFVLVLVIIVIDYYIYLLLKKIKPNAYFRFY